MKQYLYLIFIITIVALTNNSCNDNPYKQGKGLYSSQCANCHMDNGSGLEGAIPPLAGADYIAEDPLRMACIIRYGQQDTIVVNGRTYDQPMAGNNLLTEFQITNIINYINHAWGNDFGVVKNQDVRNLLDACEADKKK